MGRIFLLLFIIVPALEIWVLILTGKLIGFPATILLVILTGIIGATFAKKEGLNTIRVAQLQASQGQVPSGFLLDGICILVGGLFLLVPGFISDMIGLFLLIPQTRGLFKGFLRRMFEKRIQSGNVIFYTNRKW